MLVPVLDGGPEDRVADVRDVGLARDAGGVGWVRGGVGRGECGVAGLLEVGEEAVEAGGRAKRAGEEEDCGTSAGGGGGGHVWCQERRKREGRETERQRKRKM